MTLKRSDLVDSIYRKLKRFEDHPSYQQFLFKEFKGTRITKKRSKDLLNSLFNIIMNRLQNGEDVVIPGFGRFRVKFKWARKGRDPQTGKSILLPPRRVIRFHCSSSFKKRLNREGGP
jgi:integration host factor subunit alpha